jgi:hypothetical protein
MRYAIVIDMPCDATGATIQEVWHAPARVRVRSCTSL